MKTLQIWLVIILGPFAAYFVVKAFIETSSEEPANKESPIINPVPEWKKDALKPLGYADKIDTSTPNIQLRIRAQKDATQSPYYIPDPLPDYAFTGSMGTTTASTGTQFGQTTPEQDQRYEAIIAERLGIGAPDPTPLIESELQSALEELHTLLTQMTLPPVEDPGPDRAPHSAHDDTFTLWQQMRTLKNAGEISELAFRAIRNEHITVTYQPLVYGEPRVVENITAAQPKTALPEATE